MKLEFSLEIFEKSSDVKFHENPSFERRNTIIQLHSSCNVLVFYAMSWRKLNILDKSSKNRRIWNVMKIRLMVRGLFPADRQAALTKPIVAFRNFANAPNTWNSGYLVASVRLDISWLNSEARESPLVVCPRWLAQCSYSYPPCL